VFKKKAKTTKKVTLRMECKECKFKMQQPLKRCKHFEVRRRPRRVALAALLRRATPRRNRRRGVARRGGGAVGRRSVAARALASARLSLPPRRLHPPSLAAASPLAQIGANKQGKSKK